MTARENMNADLYRAAFARLGTWPARPCGQPTFPPCERERADRRAAMDAVRARYAQQAGGES
jgi:hypothetical protein